VRFFYGIRARFFQALNSSHPSFPLHEITFFPGAHVLTSRQTGSSGSSSIESGSEWKNQRRTWFCHKDFLASRPGWPGQNVCAWFRPRDCATRAPVAMWRLEEKPGR